MSDYPSIVYKYRNWDEDNHKRMLLNNELYLASPKGFNDPFDRGIPPDFSLLQTNQDKIDYVHSLTIRLQDSLKAQGYTYNEAMKVGLERLKDFDNFQKNAIRTTTDYQNAYWGILSLTAVWDNTLMWSHYGNNHKGFCIGFDEEKLRTSGFFGKGGNVMYTDTYPSIHPNDTTFSILASHVKAKDWEYEKEYRLTKLFYPKGSVDDRVVTIEDSFFKEVILGCDFPKALVNDIRRECMKKNIPLYQATQVPMAFKLERHPLYFHNY